MAVILFFISVRLINVYGDPFPWSVQRNELYTFFSFIKVHKYPPSLLYMCITIGPSLLFLAVIEKVKNILTDLLHPSFLPGAFALCYFLFYTRAFFTGRLSRNAEFTIFIYYSR